MHEDRTTNRNDNSAYNLAILRHMALNLDATGSVSSVAAQQIQPGRLERRVPSRAAFADLRAASYKDYLNCDTFGRY
jgi:hypothetical protein